MKFSELTVREVYAQARAACIKVVRVLDESQRSKFEHLTVDYVSPMPFDADDDFECFNAIGRIWLNDKTKVVFKADLMWFGDVCDLAGPDEDSVAIVDNDTDIELLLQD